MTYDRKILKAMTHVCCAGAIMFMVGCATGTRLDNTTTLKVMTYNIRIGALGGEWPSDPGKINLGPVTGVISNQNPDIVGLQEVDKFRPRSNNMDQPERLRASLGMNVAFAEAYAVPAKAGRDEQYGIGLISKHPVGPHVRFPLFKPDYSKSHPNYPDYYSEQRVLMHAPVMINGQQIHVFVTHLGLTKEQRQEQLRQIAEITARYKGPKLLMGDFNAEPDEPSLALLRIGFRDALQAVNTTPDGRRSFPAGIQPKNSIDYIFVSPEFRVKSARVILDETLASDHNPVVAELELPRQ